MAITSGDQVTSGLAQAQLFDFYKAPAGTVAAGEAYTLWNAAGTPSAGANPGTIAVNTAGATAYPVSTDTGAFPFTNPTGGRLSYLGDLQGRMTQQGTLILYDRIWHGNFAANAASVAPGTTFNAPATGTLRLDTGVGAELWIEAAGVATTGGGVITATYTNQGGTAARTAVATTPPNTGGRNNVMTRIPLQAGDTGCRSVQSLTLSATTGAANLNLVLLRRLGSLRCSAANLEEARDWFGASLRQIKDSACLMLAWVSTGTTLPTVFCGGAIIQG